MRAQMQQMARITPHAAAKTAYLGKVCNKEPAHLLPCPKGYSAKAASVALKMRAGRLARSCSVFRALHLAVAAFAKQRTQYENFEQALTTFQPQVKGLKNSKPGQLASVPFLFITFRPLVEVLLAVLATTLQILHTDLNHGASAPPCCADAFLFFLVFPALFFRCRLSVPIGSAATAKHSSNSLRTPIHLIAIDR